MPGQPGADLRLLGVRIIVEDDVDGLVSGHLDFDRVQEPDELLMPVPLHVAADHGTIQDIERGEQGRGPVALVVMRHGRSEEHTSELQSLMRISYDVFCLYEKKKTTTDCTKTTHIQEQKHKTP